MSLVRVTAVGICGSDLHWWDEGAIGDATLAHPLALGQPLGVALHSVDLGHLPFGGTASVVGWARRPRRSGTRRGAPALKVVIEPQR